MSRRPGTIWALWSLVVMATVALAVVGFHILVGRPSSLVPAVLFGVVALPIGLIAARWQPMRHRGEPILRTTVVVGGLVALVVAAYVIVVVGLGETPKGHERHVLGLSMLAAVVAVVLAEPVRQRLRSLADGWVGATARPASAALETFGARMTRSVPMDELLLQLAETLHATIGPAGAQVWTGANGVLEQTISVPEHPRPRLELTAEENQITAHARVAGNAWAAVWLSGLLVGRETSQLRVAPVAHLGELLGLIVVERRAGDPPFGDDEDRVLSDLARQVGLALHNVSLDSALQESLDELRRRNEELQASRARIVAASDESRRAIERNLHDGAQQHLVALAVKLGLARQVLGEGPAEVAQLLEELRGDVQTTIGELRELAHGIYPPLLRDRGLPEALSTAARRSPLPVVVEAPLTDRYPADAEAAVYFCCLEAMQNAGKYAGPDAEVRVDVRAEDDILTFEVRDNGVGFDAESTAFGHGFTNMLDRLGAIGGSLTVESRPGEGSMVRGVVPCSPLVTSGPVG